MGDFSPVMPTRLPASSRVHLVRLQANNIFLEMFQLFFRIKSEYTNGPQPDHIRDSDPQLQPPDRNTRPSPQGAAQDAAHSLWARPAGHQTSISSDRKPYDGPGTSPHGPGFISNPQLPGLCPRFPLRTRESWTGQDLAPPSRGGPSLLSRAASPALRPPSAPGKPHPVEKLSIRRK